jgi:hypothetical protein
MYSLLVLGLIPGTNIQLSFWAWLIIMPLLAALSLRLKPHIRHFIAWGKAAPPRLPLSASQLHRRLQLTAR